MHWSYLHGIQGAIVNLIDRGAFKKEIINFIPEYNGKSALTMILHDIHFMTHNRTEHHNAFLFSNQSNLGTPLSNRQITHAPILTALAPWVDLTQRFRGETLYTSATDPKSDYYVEELSGILDPKNQAEAQKRHQFEEKTSNNKEPLPDFGFQSLAQPIQRSEEPQLPPPAQNTNPPNQQQQGEGLLLNLTPK